VALELEARLAVAEVQEKAEDSRAHDEAQALANDAHAKGFGLIARKAGALAGG
jgi:hypothetical protein